MPSTPKSGATKQERAHLVFSLLNPLHDDAYCVVGISQVLNRVLLDSRKDVERDPRQGPVLRAAMKFISTRRSTEELPLLRARLTTTCRCQPRIGAHHGTVGRPLPEVLELVLFEISSTITDYFMRIGAAASRTLSPPPVGSVKPWRASRNGGATVPGGHSVFCLIGAVARYWEPFAQEVFRVPSLFVLATNHLQHALDSNTRRIGFAERYSLFITPVIACAQGFFHTLSEVDIRATICLIAPVYEQMYAIAVAIEPILLDLQNPLTLDHSRRWFHLVRSMRSVISPDGQWVVPRTKPKITPKYHFAVAFQQMAEARNRNQCLHVECTTKIVQRSSVCSRCGIVRYCSKECLTAAWSCSEHAHKSVCKKIVRLRAATLLTDDKAWARTVCDSSMHRDPAEFAHMCVRLDADVEDAEGIWRGILRLADAKLKFVHGLGVEKAQEVAADPTQEQEGVAEPAEDQASLVIENLD
ncbi:MYND-type domain-containing protein [Mycena venus]|uniref:MYND-type domain-containing protein n=1 Tax=Mycena venus TaxID=2733690 RepID=A0A8H6YR62_9AGAR|nr:MYND-type domain-containing protein [Mycena venus]